MPPIDPIISILIRARHVNKNSLSTSSLYKGGIERRRGNANFISREGKEAKPKKRYYSTTQCSKLFTLFSKEG
jgi:hypothetical protein